MQRRVLCFTLLMMGERRCVLSLWPKFNREDLTVTLSAPTNLIFIISVVIAIIAALAALGVVSFIPMPSVWIMGVAFLALVVGCLFKGA